MKQFLWQGELCALSLWTEKVKEIEKVRSHLLNPLELDTVLKACTSLQNQLREGALRETFLTTLLEKGNLDEKESKETIEEIISFIDRKTLEEKIARELCAGDASRSAFRLERATYQQNIFEAWQPLGFLVHIAPKNAINLPFFAVLEGLITGNISFLKLPEEDFGFSTLCLHSLAANDETRNLKNYLYAAALSPKDHNTLQAILREADGVSVWGGEGALEAIRQLTPLHARWIDWGPKISFAYLDPAAINEKTLENLAREICAFEQQSCSSPQVIYVDTEDWDTLNAFAKNLFPILKKISQETPRLKSPQLNEQAEITRVDSLTRLEKTWDKKSTAVYCEEDFRLYVEKDSHLKTSPLFRTAWIKPLPRKNILDTLTPMRHYLQTAGISVKRENLTDTIKLLNTAGVNRVTEIGTMLSSYAGEPHDGVYALERFCKRVSVRLEGSETNFLGSLEEWATPKESLPPKGEVQNKELFQTQTVAKEFSDLFFKSGGSTGKPKLSIFTYADYHAQMRAAANGLLAAGLDPKTDRAVNFFAAGGLYGGFLSFFTILETLKAPQIPMAMHPDFSFVAESIVQLKATALLGMPSYLLRLFEEEKDTLKNYRGIKKIFYGGEHLNPAQIEYLKHTFGIEHIQSAAYGGNDTGPIGFQCLHSQGGVHHLLEELHQMEILRLDSDEHVKGQEEGRIVLTSKIRHGQNISRYDTEDVGRWTLDNGQCPCGRRQPKFELRGRTGDIFRAGGFFINSRNLTRTLSNEGYPGEVQFLIQSRKHVGGDTVLLRASESIGWDPERIRSLCLAHDKTLFEAVQENEITFICEVVPKSDLLRSERTSKLKLILDERQ